MLSREPAITSGRKGAHCDFLFLYKPFAYSSTQCPLTEYNYILFTVWYSFRLGTVPRVHEGVCNGLQHRAAVASSLFTLVAELELDQLVVGHDC